MKRLVLLDAHAIIHRAFHALPVLTAPDGAPVQAAYGFASILLKILRELKPDYAVACFDAPGPTFRHLAFERYKAGRPKAPPELYRQIPVVKELVASFGIPAAELSGYEADDLIGTIALRVRAKHPDTEVIVVTGDLDTLQLVDDRTKVYTMRKGISDTVLYDLAAVRERYGLAPQQLVDFKGLRGDPSDNIPGVKGIGEKTASELLAAYGSIEEVYRALKRGRLRAKPAVAETLRAHEADALFSKTLATIDRNAPVSFVLQSARVRKAADSAAARSLLERLGFSSLLRRLGASAAPEPPHLRAAPRASPRVAAAGGLDAIERHGPAVLIRDPETGQALVATGPEQVWRVPIAPLNVGRSHRWFGRGGPTYVFDLKPLLGFGFPHHPGVIRDLMLMGWLLEPDRRSFDPASLVGREPGGEDPTASAEIAAALFEVAPEVEARLKREELAAVYDQIEAPLTPILYRMEAIGIGFDPQRLGALAERMARELAELEARIHRAAGAPFNVHSPRQLGEVLFGKLGIAPQGIRKTEKSGALSTRESELEKLKDAHPIVADILRFRELSKLASTYVEALPKLVGPDGRIHTTWNQTGTATGRLSSQNPNLQNIPIRSEYGRAIRKAFVADRGFRLVAFDYSQLELRIAADLAGDEKMIAAFRQGLDIHRLTAAEVHNLRLDRVTPELRYRAKALNFGILYGMGARSFAESAGIPRHEAEHFIQEYFKDFRGIARFIEATKEFARTHGYTRTAFGRRRFFPNIAAGFRLQREAERMAVNHPIQGTGADIMKKAMIEVDGFIESGELRSSVRLLLQIHDELLFEISTRAARGVIPKIKRLMEGVWRGRVQMAVEVKRGKHWGELE